MTETTKQRKDRYRKLFAAGLITLAELEQVIVTITYDSKLSN